MNPRATGRYPRARPSGEASTGPPEGDFAIGKHGPVASKLSDELREYLANQPRLVLIGVNGTAHAFQFFSFPFIHNGGII